MKTKTLFAFLGITILLACGRNENQTSEQDYSPSEAGVEISANYVSKDETEAPAEKQQNSVEQKLIKEGYLVFETDELAKTHTRILSEAKKLGGYVASDNSQKEYDRLVHYLTIRVPAKSFDAMLERISVGVDHFDEKQISVADVTEQYVDLQTRLKTKKELEARYLELLKQAKNVSDMLEIEREIGNLRSDIESMEGRFRVLQNQVAFATIQVQYYIPQIEASHGFGHEFKQAWRGGWDSLLSFFVGLVFIWPFLLIGTVTVWLIIRRMKRKPAKS